MTIHRVALYVRLACDPDDGASLDAQEQLLRDLVTLQGGVVTQVYTDVGSGNNGQRPALQQLMTDAQAGAFDTVIMRDPSRLSRDRALYDECYAWLHEGLGIRVVFACLMGRLSGGWQ